MKKTPAHFLIGASILALIATGAFAADPKTEAPTEAPPAAAGDAVIPPPVGVGIAPGVVPGAKPGPAMRSKPKTGSSGEGNPDWPCVQRKVDVISPAQVWDGPPLDDAKGWEDNEKITELTPILESRRIPVEEAEEAIKEFAESYPEAERDKMLTMLYASVLSNINADRGFVMGRIEEFQRRQRARSKELEREGIKLAEMNQEIPAAEQLGPRDAELTPEQQEYNWNARIFQERQQNLTVACEIPVLIEQRAFEIARLIRAQMSE